MVTVWKRMSKEFFFILFYFEIFIMLQFTKNKCYPINIRKKIKSFLKNIYRAICSAKLDLVKEIRKNPWAKIKFCVNKLFRGDTFLRI